MLNLIENTTKTTKVCSKCKLEKDISNYGKQKLGKDGLRANCRACNRVWSKTTVDKRHATMAGHIKSMLWGGKHRAKKRDIEFNLSFDDVINLYLKQQGKCAITGEILTAIVDNGRVKTNVSIDRIDSDKHYTIDNIQLVCDIVNWMKYDMTQDEFINWCKLVTSKEVN